MPEKSVGTTGRAIRPGRGPARVADFFRCPERPFRRVFPIGIVLVVVLVVIGAVSSGPVYRVPGLSTCPMKGARSGPGAATIRRPAGPSRGFRWRGIRRCAKSPSCCA